MARTTLSGYFNNDAAHCPRWLKPFEDLGASTVSIRINLAIVRDGLTNHLVDLETVVSVIRRRSVIR